MHHSIFLRLGRPTVAVLATLGTLSALANAPVSAQTIVYDSTSGPYSSFAASSGIIGVEDYTTTLTGTSFLLTQLRFIGGVTSAGGALQFQFQNAGGTPVTTFSVTFADPGNFIYDVPSSFFSTGAPVTVPTSGRLQLSTVGNTQGQWFLTSTPPTTGSSSTAFGSGAGQTPTLYQAFSLTAAAPEPSTLPLLLAGLLLPFLRLFTRRTSV